MEKSYQRNTYQYQLKESKFDELKKLGSLLIGEQKDVFKKAYSNLLGVLMTKEDLGLILTFSQFYDPMLHCFTFQDFLLTPTLEEFAHIVHIPIRDQVPYIGVVGFPKVVFTLLVYVLVLFPNIEGFIDKTVVTIFISRNLVSTLLVDVFFSFHYRNRKRGGAINCCIPLVYKWILTHFPRRVPFTDNIGALNWSQMLMSLDTEDVVWYCRDYDRVEPIYSYGDFHNVPVFSAIVGVINYNLVLSLHQLGYQLKGKPEDKMLEELLITKGVEDADMMKRTRHD
ncbi:uncharacterized protein LOC127094230 [Lathyrus oleraceus]|uniref:uncharacterized protein LOC127094230 n=1 Tax=Pisum sativum TaxID=3888 RepID=UPI0021D3185B|nr:uncharacterized protein LOC127094230 [Pisum sativum]